MHKVQIAEVLLSLVMPQEHAAAEAGDFAESAADNWAFWEDVLGTIAATVGETIAAHPRWAALAAGRIAAQNIALQFGLMVAVLMVGGIVVWLRNTVGAPWFAAVPPIVEIVGSIWIPFALGKWIAEQHQERGLAALVAYTAVITVFAAALLAMGVTYNPPWNATHLQVYPTGVRLEAWPMFAPFPGVLFSAIAVIANRRPQYPERGAQA